MAGRRSLAGEANKVELNLTSLIDAVFLLLIFFMVTTVFVKSTTLKDVLKKLDRESEISSDFVDKQFLLFDSADGHYKLVFQKDVLHQIFESP